MGHVLLAHLAEQLPWVARKGAKVFLDPRGMRAPTKLVLSAHTHVDHRRDVLVIEWLENEFILKSRHQRRAETCGVFWSGDHHNHGVKALKVGHGLERMVERCSPSCGGKSSTMRACPFSLRSVWMSMSVA